MKPYEWNESKNLKLKAQREVCFEDVITALQEQGPIDVISHHNPKKYPGQKVYVVLIENYIYLVPFMEDDKKLFLKTIYPSRKLTKQYLQRRQ